MPTSLTAYTYDELNKDAQVKAFEEMRHITTDHFDWHEDDLVYYIDEKLAPAGFEDAEISFTGFGSQGDGASFKAGVDIVQFLKANKLGNDFRSLLYWAKQGYGWMSVYKMSSHYDHHMTMAVESEWDLLYEAVLAETQLKELEKIVLDKARDLAREIYRGLQESYEAMSGKEYVSDFLIANDYLFWDTGKPVH